MVSRSKQNRKTNLKYSRKNRHIMSGGLKIYREGRMPIELKDLPPGTTINTLRYIVSQKQGCHIDDILLRYEGKDLYEDKYTLSDYGITDDSGIWIVPTQKYRENELRKQWLGKLVEEYDPIVLLEENKRLKEEISKLKMQLSALDTTEAPMYD